MDVPTAPAKTPLPNRPQLGGVAPGAGPVIAPDGTVYIVNGRGKLMSFRPDGTPGWSRDIGGFQGVLASPALGNDGSIYVIGSATIRDHATNPPNTRHMAELHKFTSTGGTLWRVPLPAAAGGLTASAPPNIWRAAGFDVIMVPTVRKSSGFQARLTAFTDKGAILADQVVKNYVPEATGGGIRWYHIFGPLNFCYWLDECHDREMPDPDWKNLVNRLPYRMVAALPAVAVHNAPGSGTPLVVMSDGFQDLVGYAFSGNSFVEAFRVRDDQHYLLSTPLIWPDGHVMISTGGHNTRPQVVFGGFGMTTHRVTGPLAWAAPTALGNSRFALVHRFGGVTILRGANVEASVELPGESIASAAASRNHLFVSTASALHTFDKATMKELAKFDWVRGGTSPVAIGPQGHIYAIADDRLFVFPPPLGLPVIGTSSGTTTNGGGVLQDSGIPAPAPANPQSKSYKPPLTAGGNRLFACEKLDGDDCGKGDYRTIAANFCTKAGYAKAEQFDVDSKKVKAETIDGRYCSKKKCKVFEEIVCSM